MDRQTPVLTSDEFGKFFSEYKNRFVSIAYGYVHDTDIAKDIVTDSFMYLWEHREQVNMAENIKGYIYFCVRTRCANHIKEQEVLRRAKNEITKDAYWKLQSSLNSLSSDELSKKLFQSEIIELFSRELAKMPELTRAVYQASRQEGLTYQQIAERYNISTRQVASEMQRAYAQLPRSPERLSARNRTPVRHALEIAGAHPNFRAAFAGQAVRAAYPDCPHENSPTTPHETAKKGDRSSLPFQSAAAAARSDSVSRICTALSAAPFLIWSLTHQNVSPFSQVRSRRMRPT